MKFPKDVKKYYDDGLWWSGICSYLDVTYFIHKPNTISQSLQKVWPEERKMKVLLRVVLQKDIKQAMVAKRQGFVPILLGKGIYFFKHYEKRSGKLYAEFIENNFTEIFKSSCNPTGNVFVQDGHPSPNFKAAKTALDKIGVVQISIPPRGPDLNSMENAFNLVKKKLSGDAVKYSISNRVTQMLWKELKTVFGYPIEPVGNIIKSTPKRISQVIKSKVHRF